MLCSRPRKGATRHSAAHYVTVIAWAAALGSAGCNDHPLSPLDGTLSAASIQEHRLPAKTKLDFLFVIDNSGSMCQEQKNLARNFTAFSELLFQDLQAADYRLAVVSTDFRSSEHRGRFLRRPARPDTNC